MVGFEPILFWGATFGTEILGTIMAAEGWLVTPIGWGYALLVWGYALTWFVINDRVKMFTNAFCISGMSEENLCLGK